jgi:hypothetical protein
MGDLGDGLQRGEAAFDNVVDNNGLEGCGSLAWIHVVSRIKAYLETPK